MIDKERWVWVDGRFVAWDEARIHVLSHTLHYGYGAFEGIRSYRHHDGRSAVFRLKAHVRRLFDSAKLLELELPFTFDQVVEACVATLRVNGLDQGYIRPILYLGEKEVGVYPGDDPDVHLAVICWRWGAYLGPEALNQGIDVMLSSFTKYHINSVLVKGKIVGHYVNSVLAKIEAKRQGFSEAILLDHEGYVAEGTGENLFVVHDRTIHTPGTDATILEGITRASVITLAKDLGYEVVERRLTRNDLYLADEVFFTGTAAEVTPIRRIDRRTVGSGKPGPVTKHLQQEFFNIVRGLNKKYDHWMTYYEPKLETILPEFAPSDT